VSFNEQEFRDFVGARMPALRRSAYLLCGDRHHADDLVSVAIGKLFRSWHKVRRLEQPDAYLRRMLVNAYLDERRRPWRREWSTDVLPEPTPAPGPDIAERVSLLALLGRLPARRRAVLVLRFLDDVSVEETAALLGCSTGTVKSYTSRGLAELRHLMGVEVILPAAATIDGESQ
jgi:RNA polymerase sigma-70 factor (sigma-E family)